MQQPNPYFIFKWMSCLLLLFCGNVFGQSFTYPVIKKQSKNIADVIPDGWQLLDSAKGCLNKDMYKDLALVLQYKDSVTIFEKEIEDSVVTQPRMLLILFYNPVQKNYELIEQSNTFILNHDNENMDDPYVDISIKKGLLKIDFQVFMFSGSWESSESSYGFRYQDEEFILTNATCNSLHRGSGEIEKRSYDFVKNKLKITKGSLKYKKEKVTWRILPLEEFKTFKTFLKPYTWEVEEYYYLFTPSSRLLYIKEIVI